MFNVVATVIKREVDTDHRVLETHARPLLLAKFIKQDCLLNVVWS